ncbi:MAG: PQQ-binding-like beta-propeller repeat protein [Streptosporangiales bacterium]|nr:PQQ-binding-like beta-propeller repeat protein [Streptosporangiales bacterium]
MRLTRRRLRTLAILLALALAVTAGAVGVRRYVLDAEWWQADHTTTDVEPSPLAEVGPPPGPVTATWQIATPTHSAPMGPLDEVAYGLADGQLAIVSGRGLDVRDARTGAERWHYFRSGWTLTAWAATDREIIGHFRPSGSPGRQVMAGFDADTGNKLWTIEDESPAGADEGTLRWPAGAGTVVTTRDGRLLRGLESRTGRMTWQVRLPGGCVVRDYGEAASGGDAETAVFVLDCGRQAGIMALDPGTGRVRWERTSVNDVDGTTVRVSAGVTAVWDGYGLLVVNRSGRELLVRQGGITCADACPIAVAGGKVVVAYRSVDSSAGDRPEEEPILEAVTEDGKPAWRRTAGGRYEALAAAGDRVYGLRRAVAEPLLPAAMDVVEPADGGTDTVPLPFGYREGFFSVPPWLGAAGGLLYVAYPVATEGPLGGTRLVALRGAAGGPGPVELGGVLPRAWPDACKLLNRTDLADLYGSHGYRKEPSGTRVGDVRLPHPATCEYQPKRESAGSVSVSVDWVAGTPQEAQRLLSALRAGYPKAKPLPNVADEAYDLGFSDESRVELRVGRTLVGVTVYRNAAAATRLARAAATRLRPPPATTPTPTKSPSPPPSATPDG